MKDLIPIEKIQQGIFEVHGQKVMLDCHLAELYGVETKALIQAVKRNQERFPKDFMFRLSAQEFSRLRSQIVTSNRVGRGGRRYLPYVFTEQGIAMLSSVLRSERAIAVNIAIMRAFVELRRMAFSYKRLAQKVDDLEKKCDRQFRVVFQAIRELIGPPEEGSTRRIGFRSDSR